MKGHNPHMISLHQNHGGPMNMNNNLDNNSYLNFTPSGLEDSIFLKLCYKRDFTKIKGKRINVKVIMPDKNGYTYTQVSKYFDYAIRLTPILFAGRPIPDYVINIEDIGPDLIRELRNYSHYRRNYIIKRAVLRMFEITSPTICYQSLASKLRVKINGIDLLL
jgi:hypothetical protein